MVSPLKQSVLLMFFLLMATSEAGFFKKRRVHVVISNDIAPGIDLKIHCKSKDDDLGEQILPNKGTWGFTFRPNFWGTTQFFCSFVWQSNLRYFDAFISERDYNEDHPDVAWTIIPMGPCKFNYATNSSDICFPWN
ncbi:hypothetical protein SLEP1_g43599 [Rubroshorea leprosula]|uniref:S-protein homolog n=1 Tax=Rubroshorea leprosula TaxID=152421 RepID=A0AAV5LE93_9ROSI|nr:hypothetical protein SLEP1_g43599 [Rubroshorea leprosula]